MNKNSSIIAVEIKVHEQCFYFCSSYILQKNNLNKEINDAIS